MIGVIEMLLQKKVALKILILEWTTLRFHLHGFLSVYFLPEMLPVFPKYQNMNVWLFLK